MLFRLVLVVMFLSRALSFLVGAPAAIASQGKLNPRSIPRSIRRPRCNLIRANSNPPPSIKTLALYDNGDQERATTLNVARVKGSSGHAPVTASEPGGIFHFFLGHAKHALAVIEEDAVSYSMMKVGAVRCGFVLRPVLSSVYKYVIICASCRPTIFVGKSKQRLMTDGALECNDT